VTSPETSQPRRFEPGAWIVGVLSIRQRLALWYAGLLIVTLVAFSISVYTMAQKQLQGSIDGDIKYRAQAIAGTLENPGRTANGQGSVIPTPAATVTPTPAASGSPVPLPTSPPAAPTPIPTPNAATNAAIQKQLLTVPNLLNRLDLGFEVMNTQEQPLAYAPSLNGQSLPRNDRVIQAVLHGAPATTYRARGSASLLEIYVQPIVLTLPATSASTPTASASGAATATPASGNAQRVAGVVLVARSLDDVYGTLATLSHLLIIGDLVAVLFVSIGGWLIATAGLSPLSTVTRTAREIANTPSAGGLGTRVSYRGPRDEVGTLASTFNEMLQALEQVTTAQRRFVADASHELRAPITTIKGTLEFLLRRAPEDLSGAERDRMLEDAYAEAERMAALVNELLLLARADSVAGGQYGLRGEWLDEQVRGRFETVELDQVAMDVFRHGRAQLQARHKDLRLAVTRLEPLSVGGDPGHIRQLVLILLDNAIKYTPSGGKVRISVERKGDRAVLSISDTGIGILPADLPHIFERFYRSDTARDRDEHGSGLGLAIAKWIAESHGGEIRVRTEPNVGSTFAVWLPVQATPVPDGPGAGAAAGAEGRAAVGSRPVERQQTQGDAAQSAPAQDEVNGVQRQRQVQRVRAKRGADSRRAR
jgi:two-component system, OmpR family, sensor kinase